MEYHGYSGLAGTRFDKWKRENTKSSLGGEGKDLPTMDVILERLRNDGLRTKPLSEEAHHLNSSALLPNLEEHKTQLYYFYQRTENHVGENPIGESKCRLICYLGCVMCRGRCCGCGGLQSLDVRARGESCNWVVWKASKRL